MKRAAVFFDRDNTLIRNDGYLGDPNGVVLVDGAADAIARARGLGYAVVVFSNQSGVARGMFGEEAVHAVNHRLDEMLLDENAQAVIDRHEFCPYHPEATVERYRQDSDLRKPKPGMILQAERQLALDLPRSWVVGDAPRDVDAGKAAGCRTILVKNGSLPPSPASQESGTSHSDYEVESLAEAMEVIARHPAAAMPDSESAPDEQSPAPAGENGVVVASIVPAVPPRAPLDEAAQPSEPRAAATISSGVRDGGDDDTDAREHRRHEDEPVPRDEAVAQEPAAPPERTPVRPRIAVAAAVVPKERDADEGDERDSAAAPAGGDDDDSDDAPALPRGKSRTEILLGQILDELRRRHEHPPDDFSVSKLMAGVVQVLALAALFWAYFKGGTAPENFGTAMLSLLVAIFLQAFTIALLIMGKQK